MKLYKQKSDCCGCMACVEHCPRNAIYVKQDSHGFAYPVVNQKLCVNCGRCTQVCALKNGTIDTGFDKKCYAVKHRDHETRIKSSSGGVYTALTDYVIEQNGIVYGAAYTAKDHVAHIRCDSAELRDKTRRAKYLQSDMQGVYSMLKEDLKQGKMVLFSGTPCQTAAVGHVFQRYREQLVLVDIICHGVPSPGLFAEHIAYCEKKTGKEVAEYNFRLKTGRGQIRTQAVAYTDGTLDSESRYIDYYYRMFSEDKILRESCFSCPYSSKNRPGDITIGDFWGGKQMFPEFDDGHGVSAVIANTERGEEYLRKVAECLELKETTYEDISRRNPNLLRPSMPPKHPIFWKKYRLLGWKRLVDEYQKDGLIKKLKKRLAGAM